MNSDDSNYVLTTEGHILTLGQEHIYDVPPSRKRTRKVEDHQCPAYVPMKSLVDRQQLDFGLVMGIRSRPDVEYARFLVGLSPPSSDERFWSTEGWCERPKVDPYVSEVL